MEATRMRASRGFETWLYGAALYCYPPAFRREFSAEMIRDFHDARHEPHVLADHRHVWAFRRQMAGDLVRSIALQWMRSGLPLLVVLSLVGPLASTTAVATLMRPTDAFVRRGTDDDLLVLLMVVVTLLLVIAATIIFTFWFAHRVIRRRV
jgi:hypothetical protein